MRARTVRSLCVAAVAAALSGCGGGAATTPVPNILCVTAPAPPTLVYPRDNSTNIPDGNFTLVLSYAVTPVSIENSAGVTVASNLPRAQSTSGAGYAVPALAGATAYHVIVPQAPIGCYDVNHPPPQQFQSIGTFTTQ